ncbi:hypothetical protein [Pelosinus sp. sgz500959]|uniref:hypothetical protein n=1 Tax=Pelosinus sp. sgz500959 TaxID=3242472 RepID=UPI00366B6DA5
MRNVICILLIAMTLNIQVMRQDDSTTWGELWYNDKIIWRVALLADGVRPVSGVNRGKTTLITPDIIDGLFLIRVQ